MKVSKSTHIFHKSFNIAKNRKEEKEGDSDDFLNLNIFCEISRKVRYRFVPIVQSKQRGKSYFNSIFNSCCKIAST